MCAHGITLFGGKKYRRLFGILMYLIDILWMFTRENEAEVLKAKLGYLF